MAVAWRFEDRSEWYEVISRESCWTEVCRDDFDTWKADETVVESDETKEQHSRKSTRLFRYLDDLKLLQHKNQHITTPQKSHEITVIYCHHRFCHPTVPWVLLMPGMATAERKCCTCALLLQVLVQKIGFQQTQTHADMQTIGLVMLSQHRQLKTCWVVAIRTFCSSFPATNQRT